MANEDDGKQAPDDEYEDVIEFECPVCNTRVSVEASTCPGCGAIFVTQEQMEQQALEGSTAPPESPIETAPVPVPDAGAAASASAAAGEDEETIGYELDDGLEEPLPEGIEGEAVEDLDDEAIDKELAAMEAELDEPEAAPVEVDVIDVETVSLELGYEEEAAAEEEEDAHFGTAVAVSADDHDALDHMAKPTLSELIFARAGLGMFLAGGALSLLVLLWDPLHGQPLNIGLMQLQFLVFCLSLFIVGFAIEMLQAYTLSKHDESLAVI